MPPELTGESRSLSTEKRTSSIIAPLACQATARRRKSPASPPLGHLLTPPGGLSDRVPRQEETTMAEGHGFQFCSKPVVHRPKGDT